MPEPIVIVDYDPRWPSVFQELKAPLSASLGALAVVIEHVGSTSVPGLAAKPIIDIDVVVPSSAEIPEAITRLATLGYRHQGDLGIPGREAFLAPDALPKHHLYVCPLDGEELRRHRAFRDALIASPDLASAYASLKRAAADRFRDQREAYVQAKTEFVENVLRRALRGQECGSFDRED